MMCYTFVTTTKTCVKLANENYQLPALNICVCMFLLHAVNSQEIYIFK
jgi:hypothetical protein